MPASDALLTAEEYFSLPDLGGPVELVRGKLAPRDIPGFLHGKVCNKVGALLRLFVDEHCLGEVLNNDSGVVTQRGPDTVRGSDVSFYSFARVPKGAEPIGYPAAPPELVFEVLSPCDRWPDLVAKAGEYLKAGVEMVCVVDPEKETVVIYDAHQPGQTFTVDEEITFPAWLGGLRLQVRSLFG